MDATCDAATISSSSNSSSSGGASGRGGLSSNVITTKRSRVEAAPTWVMDRVHKGEALPVVEIPGVSEQEEASVFEYAMKYMKSELFVDLMEMMG